jgi:hypothetical protein
MDLFERCQLVLNKNWKGKFTIPSPRLYPFQWNWDSGFIALGNLYTNPERALTEMETLFSGQWKNGFLPHILFHNAEKYSSYFPPADYWNSDVSDFHIELKSSGITQAPVHGFVLERMFEFGLNKERISKLLDKALDFHRLLYVQREFNNTGLVTIWHNWESGMDNSPWWDAALLRIDEELINAIELERKDVHEVAESESTRPKDLDYKKYLYLVNELKANKYNYVSNDYPFQMLDPVFNSILIQSNKSLIRLAELYGKDTTFIQQKLDKGLSYFDEYLFDDESGLYYPYDLVANEQVKIQCSGSYIPIFAGIPSKSQVQTMISPWRKEQNIIPFPSCYPDKKGFERKNYWRGPVWINMNWMIWKGLLNYNLFNEAELIKNKTIGLVKKYGIYEYFDPFDDAIANTGYGGSDFSWTAALVMDMLKSKKL